MDLARDAKPLGLRWKNLLASIHFDDGIPPRSVVSARGPLALRVGLLCLTTFVVGCGRGGESPPASKQAPQSKTAANSALPKRKPASALPALPEVAMPTEAPVPGQRRPSGSLAELMTQDDPQNLAERVGPLGAMPFTPVDENQVAAAGIRKLESKHLTLYTDLPPQPAVDELPQVFDLAVEPWCAYFDIDPGRLNEWRMRGCLMDRKEPFLATGLLPDDLLDFLHGFQRGYDFWLYEQPSDYYRRHLLLHEGMHGFMNLVTGKEGPPWYMEGMAELLGVHRWRDGSLTLGHFPQSREETPMWGRVKIVQDDYAARRALPLSKVFELGPRAHLDLAPYGWSWAAAAFLDGHPRTQAAFRALRRDAHLNEPRFSQRLREALGDAWPLVMEEWQLFVANIDYGYDLTREAVEYQAGAPLPSGGQTFTIAADRGWQSSGILVEEGQTYQLRATGRYTVAQEPQPWWCEPNGVTLRYHRSMPLGVLLATVRKDGFSEGAVSAFLNPGPIGTGRTVRAPSTGVLYFRINDSPAKLDDNEGSLEVRIELQAAE